MPNNTNPQNKQEMPKVNERPKRNIKPKKCCGFCSDDDCLSVQKTYKKRKINSKPVIVKTLLRKNERHRIQNIIFKECTVKLERIDISTFNTILKVNNSSFIINTEKSTPAVIEQELIQKPEASAVILECIANENKEKDTISDDGSEGIISSDDESVKPKIPIYRKRDVSSIIFLENINLEKSRTIFPGYDREKIEEMKEFFLDQTSKLKTFSKAELYTVDQVLELMSLPTRWIHESTINCYFKLIEESSKGEITCYKTYFMIPPKNKFCPIQFKNVLQLKIDNQLFNKRMLLIPINMYNVHWALACVDFKIKTIFFYDSLFKIWDRQVNSVVEHLKQLGQMFNVDIDWNVQKLYNPTQNNNHDCGIFVCSTAWFLAQGKNPDYEQNDMPLIRQRIAYEFTHGSLII